MLSAQTTSAEIKPLCTTFNSNCDRLDVRHPAAPGMLLGMAHAIAKVRCFPAPITFLSQILNSFSTGSA